MKVGINFITLQNNMRFRGPGTYLVQLLKALLRNSHKHQLTRFTYNGHFGIEKEVLSQPDDVLIPEVQHRIPLSTFFSVQALLPRAVKRSDVDLFHEPFQFATVHHPKPTIITIHDLVATIFPEYTGVSARIWEKLYRKSVLSANRIITVSKSTKRDLVNYIGVDPQKIRVTYLGADENFYPIEDRNLIDETLGRLGIPETYIFYAGGTHAHKNVIELLDTFAVFRKSHPEIKLVLAGKKAYNSIEIHDFIENNGLQQSVILTGFVSQEDLRRLFSGALFHMSLSMYEGFGLTFLEAMSCGTPVIGYRVGSIPEVVEDAGILLPPKNRKAVLDAMEILAKDEGRRQELTAKGKKQSKKFSWDRCAKETLEIYEELESDFKRSEGDQNEISI